MRYLLGFGKAQIGGFKVLSESGIASGVRRIEAVVGPALVAYLEQVDGVVKALAAQLKVRPEELPSRVAGGFPLAPTEMPGRLN